MAKDYTITIKAVQKVSENLKTAQNSIVNVEKALKDLNKATLGNLRRQLGWTIDKFKSLETAMNNVGKAKKHIRQMPMAALKTLRESIGEVSKALNKIPGEVATVNKALAKLGTVSLAGNMKNMSKQMNQAFADINAQIMKTVQTFHTARDQIASSGNAMAKQSQKVAQAGKEYDRMATSAEKAAKSQEQIAKESDKAAAAMGGMDKAAGKGGKSVGDLGKNSRKASQEVGGLRSEIDKFSRTSAEGFKKMVKSQVAFMAGFALVLGPMYKFGQILGDVVNIQNEFARTVRVLDSDIMSLGQQTSLAFGAMNREMLRTGKSSKEVSEVLYQLGSAGLKTEESVAALESTLNTIIGTEADVTTITKTIAGIYNNMKDQFYQTADGAVVFKTALEAQAEGLRKSSDDAKNFAAINDVLVRTFQKHQVEMSELNDGLKYSIATATAVGISFTKLTGILATLNDHMVKAGVAGRSFQAMLSRIAKSPQKFADAFGVEFDPGAPLDVMAIFRQLYEDMGEGTRTVEQLGTAFTRMGLRGAKTFLTLVKYFDQVEANIIDLEIASLNSSNKMAQVMLDRPVAALERLHQGFVQIARFTFGPIIAAFIGMVKVINAVVYGVAELVGILPESIQLMLKLTAAVVGLNVAAGGIGFIIKQFGFLEKAAISATIAIKGLPAAIATARMARSISTSTVAMQELGLVSAITAGNFAAMSKKTSILTLLFSKLKGMFVAVGVAIAGLIKWVVALVVSFGPIGIVVGIITALVAAVGLAVYAFKKWNKHTEETNKRLWKYYKTMQTAKEGNKEFAKSLAPKAIKAQGELLADTDKKISKLVDSLTGFTLITGGFRGLYTPIAKLRKETDLLIKKQKLQIESINGVKKSYSETSKEYKQLDALQKQYTRELTISEQKLKMWGKNQKTVADGFVSDQKRMKEEMDKMLLDYGRLQTLISANPLLFGIEIDTKKLQEQFEGDAFRYILANLSESALGITQTLGEEFAISDKIVQKYKERLEYTKQLILSEEAMKDEGENLGKILSDILSASEDYENSLLRQLNYYGEINNLNKELQEGIRGAEFTRAFLEMASKGGDSFSKLKKASEDFHRSWETYTTEQTNKTLDNMQKIFSKAASGGELTLRTARKMYNEVMKTGVESATAIREKIMDLSNAIEESKKKVSKLKTELAEMGATKFEGLLNLRDTFNIGVGATKSLGEEFTSAKAKAKELSNQLQEVRERLWQYGGERVPGESMSREQAEDLKELMKLTNEYNKVTQEQEIAGRRRNMMYKENEEILRQQIRSYQEVMTKSMAAADQEARTAAQAGDNVAARGAAIQMQMQHLDKFQQTLQKSAQAEVQAIDIAVAAGVLKREQGEALKYKIFQKYERMYLSAYKKQEEAQKALIENEKKNQDELNSYREKQIGLLTQLNDTMLKMTEAFAKFFGDEKLKEWAEKAGVNFKGVNETVDKTTSIVGDLEKSTRGAADSLSDMSGAFGSAEMQNALTALEEKGNQSIKSMTDQFDALITKIEELVKAIETVANKLGTIGGPGEMFTLQDIDEEYAGVDRILDSLVDSSDSAADLQKFLERTGQDSQQLSTHLQKVLAYMDQNKIEAEGIKEDFNELKGILDEVTKKRVVEIEIRATGDTEVMNFHRGGQVDSVFARVTAGEGFVPAKFAKNNLSLLNALNSGIPIGKSANIPVGTFQGPGGTDRISTVLPESSYVLSLRGMRALQRSMQSQPRRFQEGGVVEGTDMALPIADEEEKAMFELRLQVGEEERVYPVYSARDNVREIKEILERERLTKL